MNQLVDKRNLVFAGVASDTANIRVFYVDGLRKEFDQHRFCESDSKDYLKQPIGQKTWFWHRNSPWGDGYQGPPGADVSAAVDYINAKALLAFNSRLLNPVVIIDEHSGDYV
jgi:hypothetical protein